MKTNTFLKLIISIAILVSSLCSFASNDDKLKKALTLIDQLKRVEAKELLSEIIQTNPKHAEAYFRRAEIHKHFEEDELAINDFTEVTRINSPFKTEAHFEIGLLRVKNKDYKGSIIDFSYVINDQPNNHKAYVLRGRSKFLSKEYESAIIDYKKALEINPSEVIIHFDKGLAELEVKNYDEAIIDFSNVIDDVPDHTDSYFYRAFAHYEEAISDQYNHNHKHLTSALQDLNVALKLNPESKEAYFDRGEVKLALKDYVGAIADFKRTISLDPNDEDAHYMKAICNYHYGYEEQAYKEMRQIIEINPNYYDAHYFIAVYYYETLEYKKALEEFNLIIENEKNKSDAYLYRALTNIELKDFNSACVDLKEAEKLGDKEAHRYFKAAHCVKEK